ncbi:MAG: GIY-YIG nuclease family protein [Desulfarculaceae bacterium]|nr:GIY-YIG nuclease family protein [Desulfarculaceae bacterium]MCF8073812.1 GIY-YIG nuclease family protein [Desulfarculaceae bacterium]MCF8102792.1 GIY-YIG nuclease family protein [Desulfarculaceae bacterium]MCF8116236.1 GIY-YIG nuclease family protein [Desulfarculaceae bacterium]
MDRQYYVYIVTNKSHEVLYTGVTNDLARRVWEHKNGEGEGFTSRYNAGRLVYYEAYDDPETAITREKQIKKGPRKRKVALIEGMNLSWRDLGDDWPE